MEPRRELISAAESWEGRAVLLPLTMQRESLALARRLLCSAPSAHANLAGGNGEQTREGAEQRSEGIQLFHSSIYLLCNLMTFSYVQGPEVEFC